MATSTLLFQATRGREDMKQNKGEGFLDTGPRKHTSNFPHLCSIEHEPGNMNGVPQEGETDINK